METQSENKKSEDTDIAALSAGVIAVVITMFLVPGVFDVMNLIVSLTLIIVIVSYSWNRRRNHLQSVAVAGVLAISSLPGIGFISETLRAPSRYEFLHSYGWNCDTPFGKADYPCRDSKAISRVPSNEQAISWIVLLLLIYGIDRFMQEEDNSV